MVLYCELWIIFSFWLFILVAGEGWYAIVDEIFYLVCVHLTIDMPGVGILIIHNDVKSYLVLLISGLVPYITDVCNFHS